jgi:hypothetical protein
MLRGQVNSITEFKQIIGHGRRVRDDYGKLYFNILHYTGSATRLFADPDFDGEPALIKEEEMNEAEETVNEKVEKKEEAIADPALPGSPKNPAGNFMWTRVVQMPGRKTWGILFDLSEDSLKHCDASKARTTRESQYAS